jgi:hypothetical protein
MDETCILCGSKVDPETGHTEVLTEEERTLVGNQLISFTYCSSCHKLMKDPYTASSLMSSIVEGHLNRLCVYVAPNRIDQFKSKLLNLALRHKNVSQT